LVGLAPYGNNEDTMNLQALKAMFKANLFLVVTATTRLDIIAHFDDDPDPVVIERLNGNYLIIELTAPPTPEPGLRVVGEPRPAHRGQTQETAPPTRARLA
jgi:hypothetical protein